ncbi:hypothetical protein [Phocaeicola sp.]
MVKLPPIDLTDIVKLLKQEGRAEFAATRSEKLGSLTLLQPLLKEWDNIISILEKELVPQLAKGGELNSLLPAAKGLAKSASSLALMASNVLSFVPGPVGIVCSIINAIVCFCAGNIPGGLLELLGCIPGAKVGVKGGSKIMIKVGDRIMEIIMKNPELAKYLKNIKEIGSAFNGAKVRGIIDKLVKKNPEVAKVPSTKITSSIEKSNPVVGNRFNVNEGTYYYNGYSPQLLHEGSQSVQRTMILKQPGLTKGNPLSNIYSHLW